MTDFVDIMDQIFENIGLDQKELRGDRHRGWLYLAMIFVAGSGCAFLLMALIS